MTEFTNRRNSRFENTGVGRGVVKCNIRVQVQVKVGTVTACIIKHCLTGLLS